MNKEIIQMKTSMITVPAFTHHVIPLFQPPGKPETVGGKNHLAAIKAAAKDVDHIDRSLKLGGRTEIALLQPAMDFFDDSPGMTPVRKQLVQLMNTASRLRCVVLTSQAGNIRSCLEEGAFGDSMIDLCVGLVAERVDEALKTDVEEVQALRCGYKLLLLHSMKETPDLHGKLDGIDWLILCTTAENAGWAEDAKATCQAANIAFLHLTQDNSFGIHAEGTPAGENEGDVVWPEHPFGSEVVLRRPTLKGLNQPVQFEFDLPPPKPPEIELVTPLPASEVSTEFEPALSEPDAITIEPLAASGVEVDAVEQEVEIVAGTPMPCDGDDNVAVEIDGTVETSDIPLLQCVIHSDESPPTEQEEFQRLDKIVDVGLKGGFEAGLAFRIIRDRKLWKIADYRSWNEYCELGKSITRQYANRLIKAGESFVKLQQVETIVSTSLDCLPQNEVQIKELYRLKDPEMQAQACILASERGQLTATLLRDVVSELMAEDDASKKDTRPNRKTQLAQLFEQLHAEAPQCQLTEEYCGLIDKIEKFVK